MRRVDLVTPDVDVTVRRQQLESAVADLVARRQGRVAFLGESTAVVVTGRPVNHLLHLVATIITGGLWLLPWAVITVTGGERSQRLTVDDAGKVTSTYETVTETTGMVRMLRVFGIGIALLGVLVAVVVLAAGRSWLLALPWCVAAVVGVLLFARDVRRFGIGSVVERPRVAQFPQP
jgi:hypothetical protein